MIARRAVIAAALVACAQPVSRGEDAPAPPPGWLLSQGAATEFRAIVDHRAVHGGRASVRLEAAPPADGAGVLVQSIAADAYRGKRVRFSGFVQTERVTGWTGLWMRVDRPRGGSAFDNMQDRAIRGTTEWTRHEVVLDVAADATAIRFGLIQDGPGASRLDDTALEVVGAEVAVTDIDRRPRALENPGFEAPGVAPAGWLLVGEGRDDVAVTVDRSEHRTGAASAKIASRVAHPRGQSLLLQILRADDYRGMRLRATGWIRGEHVETARLLASVKAADSARDSDGVSWGECALPSGSFEWRPCAVVFDVPAVGDTIELGVDVTGDTTLWLDDVELTPVTHEVALSRAVEARALADGDFETERALAHSWFLSGNARSHFAATLDRAVKHGGAASARLAPRVAAPGGYGVLIQVVDAADYRGRRLRLTAYLKTADARGNLWVRVRAGGSSSIGLGLGGGGHAITGTTDWRRYEVVFDVPADGVSIDIGAGLDGRGTLWLDDVRLEPVGGDVALAGGPPPAALLNGGFEDGAGGLAGWFMSGGAKAEFEAVIDRDAAAAGRASARLAPRVAAPDGYGTLMQSLRADGLRGKRLAMTALVRGAGIAGRGDLWLRVQAADSPDDGPGLGGGACRLAGSFAWRPCELVFDVPGDAAAIQLGIGLAGPGTIWLDEVGLREVSSDVPVTPAARRAGPPINLDFETVAPPE